MMLPLILALATPPPSHESAAAVLARVRAATLSRPLSTIRSIHTIASFEAAGLQGNADGWVDVVRHREAQRTNGAGPLTGAQGWTGTVAWDEDASGIVRIDGGQAARIQAVDSIYVDSYEYLEPDAGGAALTYAGERHENGRDYDVIDVTPVGGSTLEFWIARGTNLPEKLNTTVGLISSNTTYGHYHWVDGINVPFTSATTTSTGNNESSSIDRLSLNEAGVSAHVQVPQSSAHDFSISGGTSTTVPIDVLNNHLYLHVMLDGQGPFTFVFDTGGAFILTPETAAALKAHASGGAQIGGVGAKTESAQFAHVDRVQIGNATILSQDFLVLPIATGFGAIEGVKIDGMVGYELPDRFLTTIAYANSTLTLTMPGTATPAGTAIPFFFDGTIPRVPISVDGVAADAELDTGNRGALDLFSPFLAAHPQLADKATTADGIAGYGVGGASYAKLGRTDVAIGPYTLSGVVTSFTTQTTGAFADPLGQSNVGGDFWKRFSLTLDYPQQRIYLAPNANYGAPFTYDRSGLFLAAFNGSVVVLAVRAGTPAATAGLAKGDAILSIDGKPASSYTLPQLRALLAEAPGTALHMHIRSGTVERDVTLTLENYV